MMAKRAAGTNGTAIKAIDPNEAAKRVILTSLRQGWTVVGACTEASTPCRTYYNWLETDPAFMAAVVEARNVGRRNRVHVYEDALMKRVESGDTTAIIFGLKTLARDVYGDRSEVNLGGQAENPMKLVQEIRRTIVQNAGNTDR